MQNISDLAESMTDNPDDHQRAVLSSLETPGNYKPPQHVGYSKQTLSNKNSQPETIVRKEGNYVIRKNNSTLGSNP